MQAGRELDALIAEKVMGLSIAHRAWPCGYAPDCGTYEAALDFDGQNAGLSNIAPDVIYWAREPSEALRDNLGYWCSPIPHYSTNIAAAWQVVDKVALIDKGEPGGLEVAVIRYPDHCECHIETNSAAYMVIEEAPTAPEAICRAALWVCGGF